MTKGDEIISLPRSLMQEVLESLYDLRRERDWWQREPRRRYQEGWRALNAQIETVEQILNRQTNQKLTDRSGEKENDDCAK